MKPCWLAVPLLAVTLTAPAVASSNSVPTPFVQRPLTLPGAVMRLDAGPRWPLYDATLKHVVIDDADDQDYLNPGLSFGLTDDFELGLKYPIQLAPDGRLRDPSVHILYRFAPGPTSVGLFAQVRLPLHDDFDDDVHALVGVPVYHVFDGGDVRLETGGFTVTHVYTGPVDLDPRLDLVAPVSFSFQISDRLYAGPEAALVLYGLFDDDSGIATPLGGFLGYTLGATLGDLYGRMRFTDVPDGSLELMFGLEFFFDL